MKVLLLRHGETNWNKENRLQGRRDIPLNENGLEQALAAGKYLKTSDHHIDLIISSPLKRARNTAKIVAGQIAYPLQDIVIQPLFAERNFGAGEGQTYEELAQAYPDGCYPGMESLEALCQRAGRAIESCVQEYPEKNILVVAHGAIIKAALTQVSQGRIAYFDRDVWVENGSFAGLEQTPDHTWKICCYNRLNGFLPVQV